VTVYNSLPPEPAPDNTDAEPAVTIGMISTAVAALLTLIVALGLPINDHVQAALLAVIATAAPIVTALWTRGRVYSPQTVARLLAAARSK